jgi:hypothetical protein
LLSGKVDMAHDVVCGHFLLQTVEMPIKAEITTQKWPRNKAKQDKIMRTVYIHLIF